MASESIVRDGKPSLALRGIASELAEFTYEGQPEHMSLEAHRRRNPELYAAPGTPESVTEQQPQRTGAHDWEG